MIKVQIKQADRSLKWVYPSRFLTLRFDGSGWEVVGQHMTADRKPADAFIQINPDLSKEANIEQ